MKGGAKVEPAGEVEPAAREGLRKSRRERVREVFNPGAGGPRQTAAQQPDMPCVPQHARPGGRAMPPPFPWLDISATDFSRRHLSCLLFEFIYSCTMALNIYFNSRIKADVQKTKVDVGTSSDVGAIALSGEHSTNASAWRLK